MTARPQPRILLVDDDADTRTLIQMSLGTQGYRVQTAAGWSEAKVLLAREPFDLLLLDLNMDEVDGEVLAEEIRLSPNPQISQLKIFFFSGEAPERLEHATFISLADGYLSKIQGVEALVEALNALLRWNPALEHG